MNRGQEQFGQLRRLLAVKRYEQPPPGYFDDFSRQVIVRIRSGERARESSILEVFSWKQPWLQRFLGIMEGRPLVAGGFGFAVCSLLLAGLMLSETTAPSGQIFQQAGIGVSETSWNNEVVARSAVSDAPQDSLRRQLRELQRPQVSLINWSPGALNQFSQ